MVDGQVGVLDTGPRGREVWMRGLGKSTTSPTLGAEGAVTSLWWGGPYPS